MAVLTVAATLATVASGDDHKISNKIDCSVKKVAENFLRSEGLKAMLKAMAVESKGC